MTIHKAKQNLLGPDNTGTMNLFLPDQDNKGIILLLNKGYVC